MTFVRIMKHSEFPGPPELHLKALSWSSCTNQKKTFFPEIKNKMPSLQQALLWCSKRNRDKNYVTVWSTGSVGVSYSRSQFKLFDTIFLMDSTY